MPEGASLMHIGPGIEDVRLRLSSSDSGYVFWRYKAWILVAERSELLVLGPVSKWSP